jgi:hypothetical protein
VFGGYTGVICLAVIEEGKRGLKEYFYNWPQDVELLLNSIERLVEGGLNDIYFCPQMFNRHARRKDAVSIANCAWADLDECRPSYLDETPTVITETSYGRFQAIWTFDKPQDPDVGEDISRRLAYKYADRGAERSGWDLTQLLRVPYTLNRKYDPPPTVQILESVGIGGVYRPDDFKGLPTVPGHEHLDVPFPDELPNEKPVDILRAHKFRINPTAYALFEKTPEDKKWSQNLWNLSMLCYEAGMSKEEVFIVAEAAACNKFKRDGKDKTYLWQDVCRAFFKHQHNVNIARIPSYEEEPLLSDGERSEVESEETWAERYMKWARGLGDAAHQYHQAGAFIALSTFLAGSIKLPTMFGSIAPNVWFMIAGSTTLTRKTSSMNFCTDLIYKIDEDALLATDGSIEGMMTALSTRPGRPSIFHRDEFTGLLEAMVKKDYMAGFAEMLTKLYDGKRDKRVLRKEVVEVKNPILIIYAGGIKSRIQEILTFDQVSSGFLPRFIFITAESDVNRVRPLGPPTIRNEQEETIVLEELEDIAKYYNVPNETKVNGKLIPGLSRRVRNCELTPSAWARFNKIEAIMNNAGVSSDRPDVYTPVYERLSQSMLKVSLLIAASRQRSEVVAVEERDIMRAAYYGEGWRAYAKEIIVGVGHSKEERLLQTVLSAIVRSNGISRSALMQGYHLSARDATAIFETLEQRGQILITRAGKSMMLHSVEKGIPKDE